MNGLDFRRIPLPEDEPSPETSVFDVGSRHAFMWKGSGTIRWPVPGPEPMNRLARPQIVQPIKSEWLNAVTLTVEEMLADGLVTSFATNLVEVITHPLVSSLDGAEARTLDVESIADAVKKIIRGLDGLDGVRFSRLYPCSTVRGGRVTRYTVMKILVSAEVYTDEIYDRIDEAIERGLSREEKSSLSTWIIRTTE